MKGVRAETRRRGGGFNRQDAKAPSEISQGDSETVRRRSRAKGAQNFLPPRQLLSGDVVLHVRLGVLAVKSSSASPRLRVQTYLSIVDASAHSWRTFVSCSRTRCASRIVVKSGASRRRLRAQTAMARTRGEGSERSRSASGARP